jgi:hypothetical protein
VYYVPIGSDALELGVYNGLISSVELEPLDQFDGLVMGLIEGPQFAGKNVQFGRGYFR